MTEQVKTISNPLTTIAIFAALAEVNATVAIGLIDKSLQGTFIWFVIAFPSCLVLLFFATLNFNNKVIYAPSDFRDEDKFLGRFKNTKDETDENINKDPNYVEKIKKDLDIKSSDSSIPIIPKASSEVIQLFEVRIGIEKQLDRIFKNSPRYKYSISHSLEILRLKKVITETQLDILANIITICNRAVHGMEDSLSANEKKFVYELSPYAYNVISSIGELENPPI